jgi:hypothetical protein
LRIADFHDLSIIKKLRLGFEPDYTLVEGVPVAAVPMMNDEYPLVLDAREWVF